jgi:hypothetical protein
MKECWTWPRVPRSPPLQHPAGHTGILVGAPPTERPSIIEDLRLDAGLGNHQARKQGSASERLEGLLPNEFGMVIMLAHMAEDQSGNPAIQVVADKIGRELIGKMAAAAHHALLDRPRIRPYPQHLEIMIRLEDQNVTIAKMNPQGIRNVAKVGGNGQFDALRGNRVAHGINGVMRNRKACHVQVADREAASGLKGFQIRQTIPPIETGRSAFSEIDRHAPPRVPYQSSQTAAMIPMLVGQQDSIELRNVFPNRRQAPRELAPTDSDVNEHAGTLGRQKNRIAETAACENADLKDG